MPQRPTKSTLFVTRLKSSGRTMTFSPTGGTGVVDCAVSPYGRQGAPAAKTTSGLLTAADILGGLITVTQGGGANSAQQLPTGANISAALPSDFAVNDSFDFSVINLGGAGETATLTVNTGVTIVGRAIVDVAAATASGSGTFRCRKTAADTYVVYRVA